MQYSLTATCARGLEELVANEITSLTGACVERFPGAVSWQGPLSDGYLVCLWSRFASRVLLEIAGFQAPDPDILYRETGRIDWQTHLVDPKKGSFAVNCTLVKSAITHSHFAVLRVKDAIVDQFRERTGDRPRVDLKRPDFRLHLHIRNNQATLSVDLSGDSLHQRGYRISGGEAPLKESLAAAVVALSLADMEDEPEVIVDPMCGSGTLLIEAALMFGDSAPGLSRRFFGFMGWRGHNDEVWQKLVAEAIAREENGWRRKWPRFIGYDADPRVVTAGRANVGKADLADRIHIEKRQLAHFENPGGRGAVIVNPPYGERLSEKEEVKYLYRCLGQTMREKFSDWRFAVLTANPDLADEFNLRWRASHRLYNGPIVCRLFVSNGQGGEDKTYRHQWRLNNSPWQGGGEDFANRLRKKCREIFKWARRNTITCFRVYDADIPAYNLAIDIYERWIHVQEYAAPTSIDPDLAARRFREALAIIREILGVKRSEVFIKTRRRQQGKQQYQKQGGKQRLYEVREGRARLLVNLTDYLDTGLFLDHRKTRAMIGSLAGNKRFLNLFGYTGAATVHAALGGAKSTTTVDLSAAYLGRAKANMALNGFSGLQHRFVQADCVAWLKEPGRDKYDLIFLDPPTFSNTKKSGRVFDIRRDHPGLIQSAMHLLEKEEGLLIFSTNFRRFKLEAGLVTQYAVQEISTRTLPHDFRHNRKIHHCYEIRWKG